MHLNILKNITKKSILCSLITNGLGFGLFTAAVLSTQPAKGQFLVSPMIVTAEAKQGVARSIVTVKNVSDNPIRIRLYPEPFTYKEDGFTVLESSEEDLSPYLTFAPKELLIEPGQIRRVRLLTRLLPSLENKEYRAVIFAEQLKENLANEGLNVTSRLGITVYVSHDGAQSELQATSVDYDSVQKKVQAVIENSGDKTERPILDWELVQNGKSIAEGMTDNYTVIANGKRNFLIKIREESGDMELSGEYQFQGDIIIGNPQRPIEEIPFEFDLNIK